MQVFIDGKEVECKEDVVVVHEDVPIDEDGEGEIYIKCTHEGIIIDAYCGDGQTAKTAWQTVDDLVEMTH